ncbi:inositol 1,4,5-trisphosphate receptor type 3-like isoform X2 [Lineus longissimus]|uniref:inositol 1,4,5-trisphosphate receptor type 3-like isoform X2 n=1 Tax=Lineus longissimus TaxID=88925 RepID=UPI00315CA0C5
MTSLCFGDAVAFFSEEQYGFAFSTQSSSIHAEIAVAKNQDRRKPNIPDCQVLSFKICYANRYKLNKKYRKLKKKSEENPSNIALKSQVSETKIAADAENDDNRSEQTRQNGKKLLYGQIIQLCHVFTGKFIQISTTQTSKTETSNMEIVLSPHDSKNAQFKIMPRYKVKAEGDVVQVDDQIVLESLKSPGQFLHVSKAVFGTSSVYAGNHELNLSVRQSGFTIYRRDSPKPGDDLRLKAGVPVRFFHKEIEAYLVAEGLFDDAVTEEVHLRVRVMDQNNPKTLFPSSSALTYWQIEFEEGIISGEVVRWEQQCRIRHMCTRKYLRIETDLSLKLTDKYQDPSTVFRLHPVIKEIDEVEYESYCRLEHVVTGRWVHALNDEYEGQLSKKVDDRDTSMAGLKWSQASLKQITVIEEKRYDDAFTIQLVEAPLVEIFNYMAGMVPFIQKLIKEKKDGANLNAKQTHEIVQALQEMKEYMVVNSVPNKNRQKLMRNLRIVELLVTLLQIPYRGSNDQSHLTKIFVESYDVLYTYLMGDSRKNELYIAKYIDFFQNQISYPGEIGLNAAHMTMELIKDNRKIVDRITKEYINDIISLLGENKSYRYLDLLSVLCVCDGVSISDNQTYITEQWLMQGKKCVFLTELGQKIGKDSNVVYVSMDNGRTWVSLSDFANECRTAMIENKRKMLVIDQPKHEKLRRKEKLAKIASADMVENFLFLEHQLDLFGKLCYGRNEFAIDVITQKLCYLTWEEAFLCLTNEVFPDQLRAKYCHLIIGMFVDVGVNQSVLDNINLSFVYDNIYGGGPNTARTVEVTTPRSQFGTKYFPQLRDWMERFLDNNKDMTASEIGHNLLVEQVLRLVHYLVRFGYYGEQSDIKKLLTPLLSLLDGRNDKPYPKTNKTHNQQDFNKVTEHYRNVGRYQESPETKAVVDAKHQAMEVLDLFFNFRFNTRLERFVSEFKMVHQQSMTAGASPDLGPFLSENYDIYDSESVNKVAKKKLKEMFQESSYFKGYDIVSILLDLSHYKYDKMVTQSMHLLNRYYSAHDNLFRRAVQAQVLITDRSNQVLTELQEILPTLRRLATAKMNSEQVETMCTILNKLTGYCSLEKEPEEVHCMNQSILYNHEILSDIFDILSQEIDVRLLDQYGGIQMVFKKTFILLQRLARGNEVVQQRLFDRLDKLLTIQGAEAEMAIALTEVFTGNKSTCMKILPYQVQKIMILVAQNLNHAPQFLDLLNAVVKVEELDLPLKRNQGYVMKYFMQYRAEVAGVIDQPSDARNKILTTPNHPDIQYLISLVDLLATCAEGENRFIESICQTIFSVMELLEVINNTSISNNLKKPYLRFFLWVYLNTAGGMIESGSGDLPHDPRMWEYLNGLNKEMSKLSTFAESNLDTCKQLLKKPPAKVSTNKSDVELHHGSLWYIFDGVMPFLQVFFRTYYAPDREHYPDEADRVDKLANTMMAFVDKYGPLISDVTRMKTMVSCMSSVLSASTLPVKVKETRFKVMENFQEKYGARVRTGELKSDGQKSYEEYYRSEEELNNQLNVFANNYGCAYGGYNDVQTQIGFPADKEYTDIGGDEELPLGEEFQNHISCFIDQKAHGQREKYELCGKLVETLMISATRTQLNEKDRIEQATLDLKCLQLLRGIIHNEIIKLPEEWQNDPAVNKSWSSIKKQLNIICEAQNALNGHDAMLKVLPHITRPGDEIVREVLGFLGMMLFAGNEDVQQSLISYFLGTREEKFFFAVKNRMQLSAIATKERRSLMAQHQAKLEEAIAQAKALRKAMKAGQMATEQIMAANMLGSVLHSGASMRSSGSWSKKGGRKYKSKKDRLRRGKTSTEQLKKRFGGGRSPGASRVSLNASSANMLNSSSFKLNALALHPPPTVNVGKANGGMEMMPMRKDDKMPLIKNSVAPINAPEITIDKVDDEDLDELAQEVMFSQNDDELEYKDEGYIELVLRVLAFMCDGQNKTLQDYLREQPDNIKSVNLVAETARFLSLVYSNVNRGTVGLITQLFGTLVEFTSGNMMNQAVAFENKVCDYINHILRVGKFTGVKKHQELELKEAIGNLVMAMMEENFLKGKEGQSKIPWIAKDVSVTVDAEGLAVIMYESHRLITTRNESLIDKVCDPKDEDTHKMDHKEKLEKVQEYKEHVKKVGFLYFHIVCRIMDLDEEDTVSRSRLVKTPEQDTAWEYYAGSTLSAELLTGEDLQKVYFRVRDKTVLREEVKDKFKYEVDRSSPSNKLRDFMDWSKDIIKDIKYQQWVLANPLGKIFVRLWMFFNFSVIFLSFLISCVIIGTYAEPKLSDGTADYVTVKPIFDTWVSYFVWVCGGIHNFLSMGMLISYFLSNKPVFPRCSAIKRRIAERREKKTGEAKSKKTKNKGLSQDDDDDDDDDDRESNLEVKFFSFRTFYYMILFGLSILGTVFWGYFFSVHLLHVATINQLLARVIRAVTQNGKSLLLVAMLFVVFFYIYAVLSFAFYRELYDANTGHFCTTMYECFVTVIHRGLIDGIYSFTNTKLEELMAPPYGRAFSYYAIKTIFDITFFILVTTIGLNIIFGIIVDTFSELRDSKWNIDNDMKSTCFICSRGSYDFEHHGGGFEKHVKLEHNQWAYLFFFIHLNETRSNDYTAIELYVHRMLERGNYDFFPVNRALALQHEEDSNEMRLEQLMTQVSYLVSKMKEEEASKQRELEKKRQAEWEKQHKSHRDDYDFESDMAKAALRPKSSRLARKH